MSGCFISLHVLLLLLDVSEGITEGLSNCKGQSYVAPPLLWPLLSY